MDAAATVSEDESTPYYFPAYSYMDAVGAVKNSTLVALIAGAKL
jgi:hypothetical protein